MTITKPTDKQMGIKEEFTDKELYENTLGIPWDRKSKDSLWLWDSARDKEQSINMEWRVKQQTLKDVLKNINDKIVYWEIASKKTNHSLSDEIDIQCCIAIVTILNELKEEIEKQLG